MLDYQMTYMLVQATGSQYKCKQAANVMHGEKLLIHVVPSGLAYNAFIKITLNHNTCCFMYFAYPKNH